MAHELVSLDALRAFLAVARAQSFRRAAEQLHVTPSAVSHRIGDLEARLEVELLERTTRSVRLTDAGRTLLAATERGLGEIDDAIDRLRSPLRRRRITVSCSPSFAILRLLPHLGQLSAAHPELEVHVHADDRMADPRREDIDLCIRYGAGNYPGLHVERLTTEWVYPVCSPGYRKTHRLRNPEQLKHLVLIHHDVMRDHPGQVDWPRWLHKAGVERAHQPRDLHVSHAHMALDATLRGEGVALGRTSLTREALERGHLESPFGPRIRSGLGYFLVTGGAPPAETALVIAWIRALLGAPRTPLVLAPPRTAPSGRRAAPPGRSPRRT